MKKKEGALQFERNKALMEKQIEEGEDNSRMGKDKPKKTGRHGLTAVVEGNCEQWIQRSHDGAGKNGRAVSITKNRTQKRDWGGKTNLTGSDNSKVTPVKRGKKRQSVTQKGQEDK